MGAYAVSVAAVPDMPPPERPRRAPSRGGWSRSSQCAAAFVALERRTVVGYATLQPMADPTRLEHGFTGVLPERRRRGLATALGRAQIAWAAEHGYEELVTRPASRTRLCAGRRRSSATSSATGRSSCGARSEAPAGNHGLLRPELRPAPAHVGRDVGVPGQRAAPLAAPARADGDGHGGRGVPVRDPDRRRRRHLQPPALARDRLSRHGRRPGSRSGSSRRPG